MSDAPAIEARDVWKIYGSGPLALEILKGVSLDVAAGELLAVFGPSGAGKTTLLGILSGLDEPTRGEVRVGGALLSDLRGRKRAGFLNRIGFVFQFYHLLPDFTALENVMLPAMIAGTPGRHDARRRAEGLLEEMGLGNRGGHYPSELSGGEQQRAAIARAMMNDPAILFCDEPTGNLDRASGETVTRFLKKLSGPGGKTVIIVTHDDTIAHAADRIVRLCDGRIAADTRSSAQREPVARRTFIV